MKVNAINSMYLSKLKTPKDKSATKPMLAEEPNQQNNAQNISFKKKLSPLNTVILMGGILLAPFTFMTSLVLALALIFLDNDD